MESTEIYDRLTKVFREVFDDDEIVARPDLTASDVEEWDSLKHVRLILSVENAFKVRFSASEVSNLKNVADLAKVIQSKV
ncbi:acyl carrier protein [Tunturibacter empetritectus]|uniref:Acyl carrier protein n=2 Tax=Tunturiibacter TaxID=3154218 RepID=A0A7W8N589_9BACT|nr:acyl carrier protein [Edaphobacter lichenicola]MBB5315607.1 acyl carrier protein [Edaphobacter lichenicola]MBB5345288.1 acyl carrier protein [Edaphobacter lichenicola]